MVTNTTDTSTAQKLFQELDPTPKQRVPKKVLDRDDFIQLFIKQLEYQDPMKPLDNNQMATQLALFSQVDQLFDLNEKLGKALDLAHSQEMGLVSNLVGRLVRVEGNTGRVENGTFLGATVHLDDPVNDLKVKIYASDGTLVKTLDLGGLAAGDHAIAWDATNEAGQKVADGDYSLRLEWDGPDDLKPGVETVGRVTRALLGDDPQLVINDRLKVNPEDLKEIISGGGA